MDKEKILPTEIEKTNTTTLSQNLENADDIELKKEKAQLEVEELRLKVSKLKRSEYSQVSFWISIGAALVAIGGVIGQNYLSNIKSERSELKVEKSEKAMAAALNKLDSAEKRMKWALKKRDSTVFEIVLANEQYHILQDSLHSAKYAYILMQDSIAQMKRNYFTLTDSLKISEYSFKLLKQQNAEFNKQIMSAQTSLSKIKDQINIAKVTSTMIERKKIDTINSLIKQADENLFSVIVQITKESNGRVIKAKFISNPEGATVFLVPAFRAALISVDDIVNKSEYQRYIIGKTNMEFTVPGGNYAVVFRLNKQRKMVYQQIR